MIERVVTRATCIEQLLYEIHDPARYLQPDVVADFSRVTFEELGPDRIAAAGADGAKATGLLKVSVGYRDGWLGEGQISYAGANCVARGELAISLVRDRLTHRSGRIFEARGELIGVNSVWPGGGVTKSLRDDRQVTPVGTQGLDALDYDQHLSETVELIEHDHHRPRFILTRLLVLQGGDQIGEEQPDQRVAAAE